MDRFDPSDRDASYNKGNNLNFLGKYEDAIQYYDKALEIDPNYAKVWYNKGLALYDKKNYEEAKKCYDKALEIDPKYKKLQSEERDTALNDEEKNVDVIN